MISATLFVVGLLLGITGTRLWMRYMEEDFSLMCTEAKHIVDRLDKALTELRQRNASATL